MLVRMSIAAYLRECGYRVHEAADSDEALTVLASDEEVDVVFTAADLPGSLDGFGLSQWARNNRPDIKVVVAGTPKRAASVAGELCDEGPQLKRPYSAFLVEDRIRRLLAKKADKPQLE